MIYKNYTFLNIPVLFLFLALLLFVKNAYCEDVQLDDTKMPLANELNLLDAVELYELAILFDNGGGQWRGKKIKKDPGKALNYIIKSAQKGYFKAQYKLAMLYYNSENIKKNHAITGIYLSKAAQQNYPEAQFMMGLLYEQGIVFNKDESLSIQWLTRAAENNYPRGQHYLSRHYLNKNDFDSAFFWLEKSSRQNYQPAMVDMGYFYYHGKSIQKDYFKAVELLQPSAQDKVTLAQYLMGKIYYDGGYGIEKNQQKAEKWYKKAAASGSFDARRELSSIKKLEIKTLNKKKTPHLSSSFTLDNHNFEKFHDDYYVIQIILAKKLLSIQNFIEHKDKFQLSICQIKQNNQPFYIVTAGYYSHYSDAKLSLKKLSEQVLFNRLNIWIRPVGQIKPLLLL